LRAVAAVDGGKSELRIVVERPDDRRYGVGPGFAYSSGTDGVDAMLDSVRVACREVGPTADVESVCLGLTGLPGEPSGRLRLAAGLRALFPAAEVLFGPDGVLAHAGALGVPGVAICAGTGTVVVAVGEDGRTARLDAWGPLVGDRGSGYAIGSAGLRAAAAALDGVAPPTTLTRAMSEMLGGTDLAALQRLHRDPALVTVIAEFARSVAAAARGGDEVATAIWRQAAADLSATAIAAARRVGLTGPGRRVAVVGRLTKAGDLLLQPVREILQASDFALVATAGDALDGGLKIAGQSTSTMYDAFIERYPGKGGAGC
jgi:glucosamine kinase